jgi:hypothetical protein
MIRSKKGKKIPDELAGDPLFDDYDEALAVTGPDAVSIKFWPNTHAEYAITAINAGAQVDFKNELAQLRGETGADRDRLTWRVDLRYH